MNRHGREAVAAQGFEQGRGQPFIRRKGAIQISAVRNFVKQFSNRARPESRDMLELPLTPAIGDELCSDFADRVQRRDAVPMLGEDGICGGIEIGRSRVERADRPAGFSTAGVGLGGALHHWGRS